MKRAVVLLGAGASIEYGAPSTNTLTNTIEHAVLTDAWMKKCEGDKVFAFIKTELGNYLQKPGIVHFEPIYHCAHELTSMFALVDNAVDEFRPLLYPFIYNKSGITQGALRALAEKIVSVIYNEFSACCEKNTTGLLPLKNFIEKLQENYVTRIYTTNYDDFPLQAVPDLYIGFDQAPSRVPKTFEIDSFWRKQNLHSIFHLHGSVHMGFPPPKTGHIDIGELCWFDDRREVLKYSSFSGGAVPQMDGTAFQRTAVRDNRPRQAVSAPATCPITFLFGNGP